MMSPFLERRVDPAAYLGARIAALIVLLLVSIAGWMIVLVKLVPG